MTVLGTGSPTLADWAKRQDPNGTGVARIAEALNQTNEILDDAVLLPGNLPTGHRVVIRSGLPTVSTRSFNEGISPSKSTTMQVDESMSMIEGRSEVDVKLAQLNGGTAEWRLSEDLPFIEAMHQTVATMDFYGNPATAPKEFQGLAPRYSSLSAGNAQNIIDGGGSSGSTHSSIWLVGWGENSVFNIFPKGSMAGFEIRDLGEQTIFDVNGVAGTRMQAYVSLFGWSLGLVVKDWRYAVRICNIDVADLSALTSEQAPTVFTNIIHKMFMATARIPSFAGIRPAFYMNRTCHSGLQRLAMEKSANALSIEVGANQFGTPRRFLSFQGIPIRLCDSLLTTEAQVT